jgi:hypothetical protein
METETDGARGLAEDEGAREWFEREGMESGWTSEPEEMARGDEGTGEVEERWGEDMWTREGGKTGERGEQ